MIHLDSCALIDLLREERRERPGPVFEALEALDENETLAVSVHVVCEIRSGAELFKRSTKEHALLDELLAPLVVVYPDARFAPTYSKLLASIRRSGQSVAAMDLLIATAAIIDDAELLTKNVKDFAKVPGLRLMEY